jgi:hypothetical protein
MHPPQASAPRHQPRASDRPQAGLGAASWESAAAGRLCTTVGEADSSLPAVVTVTQLGANRKMLSPTRS